MKSIKILSLVALLLGGSYILGATNLIDLPKEETPLADSIFLTTHWQQMGGFEHYTPDHLRLGCWSTALAQIMFYHRLKPFGKEKYRSSKGYYIDEKIDSTRINFSMLTDRIDSLTPNANIHALALYNYYAALAVEKDFGTDNYMNKLAPAALFEKHYKVEANRYISWKCLLPFSCGKQERIIREEISHKRPVFLHFTDLATFGHSVVIDGYKIQDKHRFMVHLNQGQGGPQDGWYDFDADLLKKHDRTLRVIYTFKLLN